MIRIVTATGTLALGAGPAVAQWQPCIPLCFAGAAPGGSFALEVLGAVDGTMVGVGLFAVARRSPAGSAATAARMSQAHDVPLPCSSGARGGFRSRRPRAPSSPPRSGSDPGAVAKRVANAQGIPGEHDHAHARVQPCAIPSSRPPWHAPRRKP